MLDSVYGLRKSVPNPNELVFVARVIQSEVDET